MKRFSLLLVFAVALPAQTILLEDFAVMRQNGEPANLWEIYLGEDPNQTGGVTGGVMRVTASSGSSPYITFKPYVFGYPFPEGFLQSWIKSGTWVTTTNRMRLWTRCNTAVSRRSDGGDVFQLGTYIKEHDDTDDGNKGAHYYHLFDWSMYANRWMVMEVNMKPQHQVGGGGATEWDLDPEWNGGAGVHYFDGMTAWYYDPQVDLLDNATCDIENVTLFTQADSPDDLVSSVAVTYTGTAYEVTWAAPKNSVTTYNVRYSTSSMKTNGWASGTAHGGTISSPGSAYTGTIWTSPSMSEQSSIYFAIKPTSEPDTSFYEIRMGSDPAMDVGGSTPAAARRRIVID